MNYNKKSLELHKKYKGKIELKSKVTAEPICFKADILNLSAVGAFIFGCNKFNLGAEVILKMKLAPSQEEQVFNARIVWIPDRVVQPHEYPGIGVEFYGLSTQEQQKIVEFIERNLSSLPAD